MSIGTGKSVTNATARTQIVVACFISVLSPTSLAPRKRNMGNGELLMVEKSLVRNHPYKVDIDRFMKPGKIYPRVLRMLADMTTKQFLSIVFEKSQTSGEAK